MRNYIVFSIIAVIMLGVIVWQQKAIGDLGDEVSLQERNVDVLSKDAYKYKVRDSLNVVSIGELSLQLAQYKAYHQEDWDLIRELNTGGRDLAGVTAAQLETIYKLRGALRDSIRQPPIKPGELVSNSPPDTVKCLDINDKWYDLAGCVDRDNNFIGSLVSRDSLLYIETVKYKRFLGFLWKTSKIKDRKQEILSKNPNTRIMGADFITIRE